MIFEHAVFANSSYTLPSKTVPRKASWHTGRDASVTRAPYEGGVSDERPEDSADPADSSLIKQQDEGEMADHKAGGIR